MQSTGMEATRSKVWHNGDNPFTPRTGDPIRSASLAADNTDAWVLMAGRYTLARFASRLPGCSHTVQPYVPLNCSTQTALAFAGRSKIPMTSLARIIDKPAGVLICKPEVLRERSVFMIGSNRRGIGGLPGPTQSPQIIFSAFMRILAGRFNTTKYTGHTPIGDDLKISTPSVHKERARLNEYEKKRPPVHSFCMTDPSHISRRTEERGVLSVTS